MTNQKSAGPVCPVCEAPRKEAFVDPQICKPCGDTHRRCGACGYALDADCPKDQERQR